MLQHRTKELVYWITEREKLRMGAPVADWTMRNVRYCNVRREDDKVTKWLAQHWRPERHAPWEIALARFVNWIPTLECLLDLHDVDDIARKLKDLRNFGQIWGNAYTVSTNGRAMDKVDYILQHIIRPMQYNAFAIRDDTLRHAARDLMEVDGIGTFMAGQIVADLKNTVGHPLESAPDWQSWAAPGPGSLRGLAAYARVAVVAPRGFEAALAACWQATQPLLPPHLQDLHMQDFQNCLCEFSKYINVKEGGRARNNYSPG